MNTKLSTGGRRGRDKVYGYSRDVVLRHYQDLMVYHAHQLGKRRFDLQGEWGLCLDSCLEVCSEAVSDELDHIQYYINIFENGFLNVTPEFSGIETDSWKTVKYDFKVTRLKQSHSIKRGGSPWPGGQEVDLVLVSGPSASGKTFWTKMGLLDVLFPETSFFAIDGGDYREVSVMYQLINLLAKSPKDITVNLEDTAIKDETLKQRIAELDLKGWGGEGFENLNPSSLHDYAARKNKHIESHAIFDSDLVKASVKQFLKNCHNSTKFSLVIPDTLTGSISKKFFAKWWNLSSTNRKIMKCVVHVYQHHSVFAKQEFARPYSKGKVRCCKTTYQSGTEREKQEGKKYTTGSKTWIASHKKGLNKCLSALVDMGYCIIIHNNNNKDGSQDIVNHSAIALWYDNSLDLEIVPRMEQWIQSLLNKGIHIQYYTYGVSYKQAQKMKREKDYDTLLQFEQDIFGPADQMITGTTTGLSEFTD